MVRILFPQSQAPETVALIDRINDRYGRLRDRLRPVSAPMCAGSRDTPRFTRCRGGGSFALVAELFAGR